MTTYPINTWGDITALPVLGTGDIVDLLASFIVPNDSNIITLNDATFEGNGNTLTYDPARTLSLFYNSLGGVIKNLTLTTSTAFGPNAVMFENNGNGNNWVTVENCTIHCGILNGTGSIIPYNFQDGINTSTIRDCTVNIDSLNSCGGISTSETNIIVEGCTININSIGAECGGIFRLARSNCHATCCQVNIVDVLGDQGGGIYYSILDNSDANKCEVNFQNMHGWMRWGAIAYFLRSNHNQSIYFGDIISNISGSNCFIYEIYNLGGNLTISMGPIISKGLINTKQYVEIVTISTGTVILNIAGSYSNGAGSGEAPLSAGSYTYNSTGNFSSLAPITDTLIPPVLWDGLGSGFVMRNPGLPYISCLEPAIPPPVVVPCFLPGTMIKTQKGEVDIEKLNKNDFLMTNLGVKKITGKIIVNIINTEVRDFHPVCFTKSCFSDNYPSRDTWASRFHKINYNGEMVSANDLFQRKDSVCKYIKDTYHDVVKGVQYHHLQVEDDACYFANNLIAESIGHEHLLTLKQ